MKQRFVLMMVLAMSVSMGWAQTASKVDLKQKAASDVMEKIPADALMVVSGQNVKKTLAKADEFAEAMAKALGEEASYKKEIPNGLLNKLLEALPLGEGFNPNGGIAIVVTDFAKSGFDLETAMGGTPDPTTIPVVLLVAGTDPKKLVPEMTAQKEDGSIVILVQGVAIKVKRVGDYLALSPNGKALEMIGAGKSLVAKLKKENLDFTQTSDLSVYVNIEKVLPLADMAIAMAGQMDSDVNQVMTQVAPMIEAMKDVAKQLDSWVMGVDMESDAIVLNCGLSAKPGTAVAKVLGEYKPSSRSWINRLPNTPYVLAMGMQSNETLTTESTKWMLSMFKMGLEISQSGIEMPEDLEAKWLTWAGKIGKEVTATQSVLGSPAGPGLFSFVQVVECKSAKTTRDLVKEEAVLLNDLFSSVLGAATGQPDFLKVSYQEKVLTLDGASLDAIKIDIPMLTEMAQSGEEADEVNGMMTKILGEDQIRVLIGQPDMKTLVATMGGEAAMKKALETAKKGGPLASELEHASKYLPKETIGQLIFSPKNTLDWVRFIVDQFAPGEMPAEIKFKTALPIAAACTVKGTACRGTLVLPNEVIMETTEMIRKQIEKQEARMRQIRADMEMQ
jgi:hypothetical protein